MKIALLTLFSIIVILLSVDDIAASTDLSILSSGSFNSGSSNASSIVEKKIYSPFESAMTEFLEAPGTWFVLLIFSLLFFPLLLRRFVLHTLE